MMRYASGSTGIQKGITRIAEPNTAGSADYYDTLRYIASQMFGFRASAHFMTAAPLYQSAPNTLKSMTMAMENMSVTLLARFEPVQFLETIDRQRITHVYLVPTMMVRLLKLSDAIKARYNLSCVEFCVSTGSPAPHPVKRAMIDWWGPVFWETYSASEFGFMTLVSSPEALQRPGTVGRIQLGGAIKICTANGGKLPTEAIGDIFVRMPAFGQFHYTSYPKGDSWKDIDGHACVGDIGWLDIDGFLFITNRKKDMIISGGADISPT